MTSGCRPKSRARKQAAAAPMTPPPMMRTRGGVFFFTTVDLCGATQPARQAGESRLHVARDCVDEALARRKFFEMPGELRIRAAPVDLRETEIEVTERAAHRDVGERIAVAVAPGLVAHAAAHGGNPGVDLCHLAVHPLLRLLRRVALCLLQPHAHRCIEYA